MNKEFLFDTEKNEIECLNLTAVQPQLVKLAKEFAKIQVDLASEKPGEQKKGGK